MSELRTESRRGFTLIEILLVIGLIAILAAVVIVAINPARQFAQARNTQRWSNVNTILNAVHQYAVDNTGTLPAAVTATGTEICATGAVSCTSLIDLSVLTANEIYLVSLPLDPLCPTACNANGIGYTIIKSANGRVTVAAPDAELGVTVSVTR
ncbi:type II secretion system protein [Candidatus Uhrbacteria bacterium]|nr:type II secretion system protein [Candidatus Uhrbacteria bacterium]